MIKEPVYEAEVLDSLEFEVDVGAHPADISSAVRPDAVYAPAYATSRPVQGVGLDQLRQVLLEEGLPVGTGLYVDRDGQIILGRHDSGLTRPLSELTLARPSRPPSILMRSPGRFKGLRRRVWPIQRTRAVRCGSTLSNIQMGTPTDSTRVSKLTQETFATNATVRQQQEKLLVERKMPAWTRSMSDGTYSGWLYEVENEFLDTYKLFLWHDPTTSRYKVSLVSPRLEGTVDGHGCHLYHDGTLCLNDGIHGYKDMERADARSVLWTRGAGCFQRGLGFQFSKDSSAGSL